MTAMSRRREALLHRPVMHQARGMIMALGHCTAEETWEVLLNVSQHNNINLRTVAKQFVATTTGHPMSPPLCRALTQTLRGRAEDSRSSARQNAHRRIR
ncbi:MULTISPECIES: ANTAR domain-containing protein [unclassified Streptomyces]|uniref:ANTAR domain-containing protein n=1 Tax=unclassified Streptomyces TaxID=2593676 RepID=UPI001EFC38EE|nr:ANTAR domain-containing protein [Streptomyces sp. MnatMP-M77]